MDAALRALADSTRRHILTLVWHEERTASEIASKFSMSHPAVSQHLKVLLDSDLVSLRRSGTRRFYHVNQSAIAKLQTELALFWGGGLSRLKKLNARFSLPHRPKRFSGSSSSPTSWRSGLASSTPSIPALEEFFASRSLPERLLAEPIR